MDLGAPESWEVADLDESIRKLLFKDWKRNSSSSEPVEASDSASGLSSSSSSSSVGAEKGGVVSEEIVNQVDDFLRDALQNPRKCLPVLQMEQDVEKFIRDPSHEQLEFHQLPTSYLRLAAHLVAQHYSLQSTVLLDNSLTDGFGSTIIVQKMSECRLPVIRLANIPVNFPAEDSSALKFAIKKEATETIRECEQFNFTFFKVKQFQEC